MKHRFAKASRIIVAVLTLTAGLQTLLSAAPASATYRVCPSAPAIAYGRASGCSYFLDGAVPTTSQDDVLHDGAGHGIPAGTNSVAALENMVAVRLASGVNRQMVAADVIVYSMLGCNPNVNCVWGGVVLPPATYGNVAANPANPFWAAWTSALSYAVINYHTPITYLCSDTNSLYDLANNDIVYYTAGNRPSSADPCGPTDVYDTVGFYSHDGSTLEFQIKWDCGNPIGALNALQKPPTDYTNTLTMTTSTPTVTAGGLASFAITVHGSGSVQGPVMAIGTSYVTPAGGAGYFGNGGSAPAADAYGPSTDTFQWVNRASPPPAGNTLYLFNLTTSPSTPTNTYCFNAVDTPYSNNPVTAFFTTPNVCITVNNPKIPLLNVAAGDVHAGCGSNGATIITNGGSSGAEVVSASGTISGLSSAVNKVTQSLNNYSTVQPLCLPNLWSQAIPYLTSGGIPIAAGSNVDLATLGASGVYVALGNITIHGVVSHNITLVVQGTVTVNGTVTFNPAPTTRTLLPDLGVIASGGINIVPSGAQVDEVDGYYWTSGTINTCSAAPGNCNNVLQVDGALMGNKVALQRYGGASLFGNTLAENVAIMGQVYLNPPPLFATINPTIDDNADGRGEQTPRY